MKPARLLARVLGWLTRPGVRALDALDDPCARRDCPGGVCADPVDLPDPPEDMATRRGK